MSSQQIIPAQAMHHTGPTLLPEIFVLLRVTVFVPVVTRRQGILGCAQQLAIILAGQINILIQHLRPGPGQSQDAELRPARLGALARDILRGSVTQQGCLDLVALCLAGQ